MSSSPSTDDCNRELLKHEQDLYKDDLIAHKFTSLHGERSRANLESLDNWRQRFPFLNQLCALSEPNFEIIHMEASLNLLSTLQKPEGSDLCSCTMLSVPGLQADRNWKIVTTLDKPAELYRDDIADQPGVSQEEFVQVAFADNGEAQIKVPFPAVAWAQAFSCLQAIQAQYEEQQQHSFNDGTGQCQPAHHYVKRISMYQDVQSAPDGTRWTRRATILWTFRKALNSQDSSTTFRYLEAPPRRTLMSPSPAASHHIQANMSETFNTWSSTDPTALQHLDPFVTRGLQTPPHTAGLHSSFPTPNLTFGASAFDLPDHNLSFQSNTSTIDSEATLVDANINSYAYNNSINIPDFVPAPPHWQLQGMDGSFQPDSTWALGNFTVPSTTPTLKWDPSEAKSQSWPDLPLDGGGKNWATPEQSGNGNGDGDRDTSVEKEWREVVVGSPDKGSVGYIEQSLTQKLLPWTEEHGEEPTKSNTYDDVVVPVESHSSEVEMQEQEQKLEPESHELEVLEEWHAHSPHDDFDYSQMKQLK